MNIITRQQRFLQTIAGQLNCELVLGGIWLPTGNINITAKTNNTSKHPAEIASAATNTKTISSDNTEPMAKIKDKQNQLKAIADKVAQCTKCQLYKTRLNTVPGEGNPQARIFFVGEAPGQNEDEQGIPFVGRAGKLLDNIIKAMGLTRQDVFIGNILKCRPPGNRDPQAEEIVSCTGYLQQQLEIINPDIIIALGAHAAKTLLNTNRPIGQLRGQVHQYQPGLGNKAVKLIATYHPAYLLRNYTRDCRLKVWQDMQMALKEISLMDTSTKSS